MRAEPRRPGNNPKPSNQAKHSAHVHQYGKEQKARHDEWLEGAMEYKMDWERTLERRKVHGIVAPDPIPHPDDIITNTRTDEVDIKGPMTRRRPSEHAVAQALLLGAISFDAVKMLLLARCPEIVRAWRLHRFVTN
jgi:hypothetical protein